MAKHVVARVGDIPDGGRLLLDVRGRSIGVFNVGGRFYALLNRCPHQGAELCRGSVLGRLEAIGPGEIRYDPGRYLLQCPWHGWEYDLATGESFFDSRVRSYDVDVEDAGELDRAEAAAAGSARIGGQRSALRLRLEPLLAETFPVSVQDDYLVVHLPGGSRPRGTAQTLDVRVEVAAEVADGVLALDLVAREGGPMPAWAPGDHIDLLRGDGLERQYSLCGDPSDSSRWRIAVLRVEDSRGGSAWVHDELRDGSTVTVRGPRSGFVLVDAPRYLLVAGGIGITPLLPMVQRIAATGADWTLLYGGRRRASMAFADLLERHGDHVMVRPEDEHGLLDLDAFLRDVDAGTAVYCCGPEPLIAAVEKRCAAIGGATLHVERFRPRPDADAGERTAFDVVLERSGLTLRVDQDQSILDAVDAAGVDVPRSCREGICGTCETAVLAGEPDHRDSFLSDEELADGGTMMICCSRSRGDRLVLDL